MTSVRDEYLPPAELEGPLRLFRDTSLGVRYLLRELAHRVVAEPETPAEIVYQLPA